MENSKFEGIARCPQLEELYISKADVCLLNDLASTNLQSYELQFGGAPRRFREYDVPSKRILEIEDFDVSTIVGSKKNLFQNADEVHFYRGHGGFKNVIPDMVRAMLGMNELRTLQLSKCEQIECLTDADSFQEDALLPRLVNLQLISLPDLTEWCRGWPVLGLLEKLEELRISECWNVLKIFPKEGQLSNLKVLDLYRCGVVTLFSLSVAASLQQLAELTISECEHLRHIITCEGGELSVALHNSHSIFPNLKKLDVCKCHKLQFVFPISRGQQGLAQLQEIKKYYCNELEYVFGPHDHEQNNSSHDQNEIQIMLPSLQLFELNCLGNLTGMCPRNCHASWPSLKKIYWYGCPRFAASPICSDQPQNVGVTSADDHIKHFIFKLESLWSKGLSELRLICFNPQILSFQYLQNLDVKDCSRQKYIFPRAIQINLPELTSLRIAGCDEPEEIIAKNEEEPQNHSNAQVCLPKLKNLYIFHCNKLKSLFFFAMAKKLPQLRSLCVQECAQLKEIFRCTANKDKIVLPNLSSVTLHGLPRLVDICQGCVAHTNATARFMDTRMPQLFFRSNSGGSSPQHNRGGSNIMGD